MNTLRKAVREYLELRRSLGFKLREAGKGLTDFVTFVRRQLLFPVSDNYFSRLTTTTCRRRERRGRRRAKPARRLVFGR
jgi:hypothetical protein